MIRNTVGLWLKAPLAALAVVTALCLPALAQEAEFPHRAKFPNAKYISTDDLRKNYKKSVIVDVRAKIEFDVIHINKAVNLPLAEPEFLQKLEKLRKKSASTPIVFYCNGHSCAKSYEAVDKASKAGFRDVLVYDAGITSWVKTNPQETTLMGKSPAPLFMLLTKQDIEKRSLSFDEFKKKAQDADAVVVDIREPFQRKVIPELANLRNISSDELVPLLMKGEFKDKQLLIMDAVGKQVEWIQYYLESEGYSRYHFLAKGVGGLVPSK